MFNIVEMHWEIRWQDQPSGTLILQLALGAMAAWHQKWTPCLSIDTIRYAIYIYICIMYIYSIYDICRNIWYNVHLLQPVVTDLWSRSLFRRSCGCGLCWSLAAADGSIQAGTEILGTIHGDLPWRPDLQLGQLDMLDMSGTISTEKNNSDNRNWYAALTFRLIWDRSGRDPEAILPEQLYSEDISIDISIDISRFWIIDISPCHWSIAVDSCW